MPKNVTGVLENAEIIVDVLAEATAAPVVDFLSVVAA